MLLAKLTHSFWKLLKQKSDVEPESLGGTEDYKRRRSQRGNKARRGVLAMNFYRMRERRAGRE
jgi:hypothetical protein